MNINITNAGSETLTNFPAYINLTYGTDMLSNFNDIRFYANACSNGGSLLDYEIENYTDSSRAHIWVRIPSLPSTGTTISVYYDNNTAITSGENPTGVWDTNYKGVWHMKTANATDSTTNQNNATEAGGVNNTNSGVVANANIFDGVDDSINAGNDSSLNIGSYNVSIEAWFKYENSTDSVCSIVNKGCGCGLPGFRLMISGVNEEVWWAASNTTGGWPWGVPSTTSYNDYYDNQWHYVVGTTDRTNQNASLYIDSIKVSYDNVFNGDMDLNTSYNLRIGRGDCGGLGDNRFNGTIDEVRLARTVRSASWINMSYLIVANQSQYVSFGSEESKPTLWCSFIQNTTCPGGSARLIGLENDTEGYNNAHTQNNSYATYNYSICCNSTNASITITTACPGNATVIRLSNGTNAHVEIGTNSNYINASACLSSSWQRVSCNYPTGSCSVGYACILSMANSEGANTTNAHVGTCSAYYQKVCCVLSNSAPTQPTLYHPSDGNTSVFTRRPNFNWSTSTDPDADSVDYTLNVTCAGCSASCYQPLISSITTTNYTLSSQLCVDTNYTWTVSACDPYDECNTSTTFSFNITSVANLELIINTTSFGTMSPNANNDTTDDSPTPLVARSTGNVFINVSVNATALFASASAGMNTRYYQFKADLNESNSFTTGCSQYSSFANMSLSAKTIFCNMSYEDANDEGEIELNITIPADEPAGTKSSNIEVGYYKIE
jgi:hypothetical protein